MRRFLKDCLIFFLGIIVVNLLTYRFISYKILFQEYEQSPKISGKNSKIIFADSHGWPLTKNNEIGTKKLAQIGVINFSYGSDSYFDILFKLKYLIKSGVSIDTVFLSADGQMLSPYKENANNTNRSIYYAEYVDYIRYRGGNKIVFLIKKYVIKYFPFFQTSNATLIREYLLSKFSDQKKDITVIEWSKLNPQKKREASMKRIDYFYSKNEPSKKCIQALMDIIKLCNENDIKIIGIKFPLPPEFIELSKFKCYNTEQYFLNSGLSIIDFSGLLSQSQYFANQDHINSDGALKFINAFIEKIK